jgi:hypothetical protein
MEPSQDLVHRRTLISAMLNFQFHARTALLSRKDPSVPIGQEAEEAPEPIHSLWNKEKTHAPAEN